MRRLLVVIFSIVCLVPTIISANTSIQPVITPENANQLEILHSEGRGHLQEVFWSPQNMIAIRTEFGTWVYDGIYDDTPRHLPNEFVTTFSVDGTWLVTYQYPSDDSSPSSTITIYDVTTWDVHLQFPYVLPSLTTNIPDMLFLPDRQRLFVAAHELRRYRYDTNSNIVGIDHLDYSEQPIDNLTLSPEGTHLSYIKNSNTKNVEIVVRDLETYRATVLVKQGDFFSRTAAFTPDNAVMYTICESPCGDYGELYRWDFETSSAIRIQPDNTYFERIDSVQLSPDGNIIAVLDRNGTFILLDAESYESLGTLHASRNINHTANTFYPMEGAFNADATQFITIASNRQVLVWDVATQTLIHEIDRDTWGRPSDFSFRTDENGNINLTTIYHDDERTDSGLPYTLVNTDLGTLTITDTTRIQTESGIENIIAHPNDETIIIDHIHGIQIHNTQGILLIDIEGDSNYSQSAISADGSTLAIIDCDPTPYLNCENTYSAWHVTIYNAQNYTIIRRFTLPFHGAEIISGMALSETGDQLVIRTNVSMIGVWDTMSGDLLRSWHDTCDSHWRHDPQIIHSERIMYINNCNDGGHHPFKVMFWDANGERSVAYDDTQTIFAAHLSPDENLLAVQSNYLYIIDRTKYDVVRYFDIQASDLQFSPDGRYLIARGNQLHIIGIPESD